MSKVFSAHAVSVDGYISGRTPDGDGEYGRGLADAPMLFDWYFTGDTPSRVFDGFRLSEPSARFFDAIAARVGAPPTSIPAIGAAVARIRRRASSSSATGPRPGSVRGRRSSPPASRTRSPPLERPRGTRTSP